MALSDKNLVSLAAAEHIGPGETGDNIDAKKVANYVWNGSEWQRTPFGTGGLITKAWDYVAATYPNDTTEVYTFKTGGSVGATTDIITVVYTDSTKADLSSASRA